MDNKALRFPYNEKEKFLSAFLLGCAVFLLAVIPVMVCEKGYFIYYGDYNAQQIPFHSLLNDAIRGGQLGWNWYTDLGSDLLSSYSFYLISSPFFLLTVILPKCLVLFSIPVILALKHGVACLTAYIYIRRFVRGKNAALTGALLYTFSGFQVFNVFFNHFHDTTALFPLMLIAMEENIVNGRKGWFAAIVAVMAAMNYYFFTGEVVFLIIYFIIRMPCKDFPVTPKKFMGLFIEAVLGTAAAAMVLLPSAIALLGNYRISEHLHGDGFVLYRERSRVIRVIQTLFMPVDAPARPNLFKSENAKWSSVGGYLPLFSMLGVITFVRTHKKHWAVRLSLICLICAFIPILNSMFYTFNGSYYARWFFMPILIMAMMTAVSLDDEDADFSMSVKISVVMLVFFGLISFIPELKDKKLSWFTLPYDFAYFWLQMGIAAAFLVFAVYIIHRKNKGWYYENIMVYGTCAASLICLFAVILYGASTPAEAKKYIGAAIDGKSGVYEDVSDDNFFRVDISEGCDNYPMLWGLPSMRAFQSVVDCSVMDFYDFIGIQRDVASRADVTHYTLRGLLSVKYFYREKVKGFTLAELSTMSEKPSDSEISDKNGLKASRIDITEELPEFRLVGENEYFEIYENQLYIPMGFGYDSYVAKSDAENKMKSARERLLIEALVLSDEQIEKYGDILHPAPHSVFTMTKSDYTAACEKKRANCCDSFTYDSHGFKAEFNADKPQLVFFSVPYNKGWSAKVNGENVDVEKVSGGFMAVKVEKGVNNISFTYRTVGLTEGIYISVSAIILLAAYLVICRIKCGKAPKYRQKHSYDYESCQKIKASVAYNRSFDKKN